MSNEKEPRRGILITDLDKFQFCPTEREGWRGWLLSKLQNLFWEWLVVTEAVKLAPRMEQVEWPAEESVLFEVEEPDMTPRPRPRSDKLPSWWGAFLLLVSELPDRNSPEDAPDALLATTEELTTCARIAEENSSEAGNTPSKERAMRTALEMVTERVERPPDANCCCHALRFPPCVDCVNHGGEREMWELIEEALR